MTANAIDGASPPDTGEHGTGAGRSARFWHHWIAWVSLGLAVVLVAALVTLLVLGAHYQPIGFGGTHGVGGHIVTRQVNHSVAGPGHQIYLPIQRSAHGAVTVSIVNNGPFAVTIESASLNGPLGQDHVSRGFEALRDTGTPRYWLFGRRWSRSGTRLAGLVLQPGQDIVIRLPVVSARCWMPHHGFQVLLTFWVTTRFLLWTHHLQVWFAAANGAGGAIVAHEPESASHGGVCPG